MTRQIAAHPVEAQEEFKQMNAETDRRLKRIHTLAAKYRAKLAFFADYCKRMDEQKAALRDSEEAERKYVEAKAKADLARAKTRLLTLQHTSNPEAAGFTLPSSPYSAYYPPAQQSGGSSGAAATSSILSLDEDGPLRLYLDTQMQDEKDEKHSL